MKVEGVKSGCRDAPFPIGIAMIYGKVQKSNINTEYDVPRSQLAVIYSSCLHPPPSHDHISQQVYAKHRIESHGGWGTGTCPLCCFLPCPCDANIFIIGFTYSETASWISCVHYLIEEGYVIASVCLSVCWFVYLFVYWQLYVTTRLSWNFTRPICVQGELVVVWKSSAFGSASKSKIFFTN